MRIAIFVFFDILPRIQTQQLAHAINIDKNNFYRLWRYIVSLLDFFLFIYLSGRFSKPLFFKEIRGAFMQQLQETRYHHA